MPIEIQDRRPPRIQNLLIEHRPSYHAFDPRDYVPQSFRELLKKSPTDNLQHVFDFEKHALRKLLSIPFEDPDIAIPKLTIREIDKKNAQLIDTFNVENSSMKSFRNAAIYWLFTVRTLRPDYLTTKNIDKRPAMLTLAHYINTDGDFPHDVAKFNIYTAGVPELTITDHSLTQTLIDEVNTGVFNSFLVNIDAIEAFHDASSIRLATPEFWNEVDQETLKKYFIQAKEILDTYSLEDGDDIYMYYLLVVNMLIAGAETCQIDETGVHLTFADSSPVIINQPLPVLRAF